VIGKSKSHWGTNIGLFYGVKGITIEHSDRAKTKISFHVHTSHQIVSSNHQKITQPVALQSYQTLSDHSKSSQYRKT